MKRASSNIIIFFLIAVTISTGSAQKIGEWTSYLPYQAGFTVTQSIDKIYYGTEWSLLQIDKEDFSSERISKVDGLSDIGIKRIEYDEIRDQLIIAYNNGNVDIKRGNLIVNLPNIKLNTDLSGNKSINDIHISGDFIYMSTGFGLVSISGSELLFGSTTFTDVPVNDAVVLDDEIFIATEEGVYFAPLDGSQNLIDFSLWDQLDQRFGMSSLYNSTSVAVFNNELYFVADGVLYSWDRMSLVSEVWSTSGNAEATFLSSEGSNLMIGVVGPDGRGDILFYNGSDFILNGAGCNDVIQDAIEDQNGRIWFADRFAGFRTAENINSSCQRLNFESPFSHEVSNVDINRDRIYVASGGIKDNYDYSFSRSGYYIFQNNTWKNFNQDNEPFIGEADLLNFLKIKSHPSKDEVYIGTYWGGLLKHDLSTDDFSLFDDTNSALLGTIGDQQRERVTGLHFDNEENLWITSFGSPRPLAILSSDGEWSNFSIGNNKNLIDIAEDDLGFFWMPVFGNNGGCYIYSPGEDLKGSGDDQVRFISSFNSELTTNVVNTVAVDLEGAIWLGTSEGPVIFDCGIDAFEEFDCQGDRIKVVQDSIVAFLLADQDILSIAIDGANQKWFGTRNGIFVQSPDGEEEIYRFTVDNSPLFDNRIRDLAYNQKTGEMVIGTDKGLQSYKTPSTEGQRFHSEQNVLVYPNPVEPNYRGPIAIKGLVRDAFVQITDVNGNLVTEVRALGGQAIWDGRDQNGNEVSTGIYLIFSTDDRSFDSPDRYVTKVMVIR